MIVMTAKVFLLVVMALAKSSFSYAIIKCVDQEYCFSIDNCETRVRIYTQDITTKWNRWIYNHGISLRYKGLQLWDII